MLEAWSDRLAAYDPVARQNRILDDPNVRESDASPGVPHFSPPAGARVTPREQKARRSAVTLVTISM